MIADIVTGGKAVMLMIAVLLVFIQSFLESVKFLIAC